MGKHEKGTPKEIANRCKSKGLQKLRWFCQMCQKQCRDQNGFKCHLTSEAHQRQLLLFAENPDTYLKEYSANFEKGFLNVLRCTFGTKRVRANEVYQEYIRDKLHVHMNSTVWHTLTNFVQYLGSSGKCRIDLTEKGWFIALIDQAEEMRKEELVKRAKADRDDDERVMEFLEQQAERARESLSEVNKKETKPTMLLRNEGDEKIAFSICTKKPLSEELIKPSTSGSVPVTSPFVAQYSSGDILPGVGKRKVKSPDSNSHERSSSSSESRTYKANRSAEDGHSENQKRRCMENSGTKKSILSEIMEMEEQRKEKQNRKDFWLHEGIVVKVITKKLGNEFYKAKGIVESMVDDYTANVSVDGNLMKLDQKYLETVIPAIGRQMLIVNGAYRRTKGVLEEIIVDRYSVKLRLDEGFAKGRVVVVPYEDASKLACS